MENNIPEIQEPVLERATFEFSQEAKRWIKDKSTLIEVKKGWNLKKEEIINP